MLDMMNPNMFSKAIVRMDVKLDEVKNDVKSNKGKNNVKPGARPVVVEVDVHE